MTRKENYKNSGVYNVAIVPVKQINGLNIIFRIFSYFVFASEIAVLPSKCCRKKTRSIRTNNETYKCVQNLKNNFNIFLMIVFVKINSYTYQLKLKWKVYEKKFILGREFSYQELIIFSPNFEVGPRLIRYFFINVSKGIDFI